MLLPIALLGENILRKKCSPVKKFDAELKKLCNDMAHTMYNAEGIGIAAPQIKVPKQIFIMDVHSPENNNSPGQWCEFINPKIVAKSEERQEHKEGCLSIPNIYYNIWRPSSITVQFQDYHGEKHQESFSGLAAICVQHEIDHLKGKLFIDYIAKEDKIIMMQKMLAANYAESIAKKELCV